MSIRRLVAAAGAAGVLAVVPVVPAFAEVTDLYVGSTGADTFDCTTPQTACATVQHAVDLADATGTTIHVGAGTFDGLVESTKDVTIAGAGTGQTTLLASGDTAFRVVDVGTGTTTLEQLTVHGDLGAGVLVYGTGHLVARDVVLDGGGCALGVLAGAAEVSDSLIQHGGGSGGCNPDAGSAPLSGDIGVGGGAVTVTHSQLLDPGPSSPGVEISGGSFTADQAWLDDSATNDSDGIHLTGGTATVTRSVMHGFGGSGVFNDGATALVSDDTFQGNAVGVTGNTGPTTVVRSTFTGELAALQGTVAVAGSVFGPDSLANCGNATVDDLGYNLSTDHTCDFMQGTSRQDVGDLDLDTSLADHGGPFETVGTLNPSPAVDAIPAGATYGASATPLCPTDVTTDVTTDVRGVPRPVGGACDAGSMELAATTTSLTAPGTATLGQDVTLEAGVSVVDVGVPGLGLPGGTVTFRSGDTELCPPVVVDGAGQASCTTDTLPAGTPSVSASFTPAAGSTFHGSASSADAVLVGTAPLITGPDRVIVHVGRKATIRLRASGLPTPVFTVVRGHAPAGMRVVRTAGRLTITGRARRSSIGRHRIVVRADNTLGRASHRLVIVVRR